MAQLFPSLDILNKLKVQPTAGERKLLNFLCSELDDSYEVYFQPFINGDMPDFAVMRRGSGVLLIEVKDWDLRHYMLDDKTNWILKKENQIILSPFKQVDKYKKNLYNIHVEKLYERSIKNKYNWQVVNCAVYFHNATASELNRFLFSRFKGGKYSRYRRFLNYIGIWGKDSLNSTEINKCFTKFWLNKKSRLFDDELYLSVKRYLKPPIHQIEEGKRIRYTKEQKVLIKSEVRPRRKIKGVAGSGKTLVLAKRAVNAHIRTGGKVLVLTYNVSLKNYIRDRISDVRENFEWKHFYITNYHQFFKAEANNYNLKITELSDFDNIGFFNSVKSSIQKFDVVLIDEVQDYLQEWIDIIAEYFIHDQTEFVVFGDEKQNIYEREMDENNEPIVRTIPARWNKSLNTSHRFANNIANIAIRFQKTFFEQKYNFDEIKLMAQLDFEKRLFEYKFLNTFSANEIVDKIFQVITKHQIHSSDVGILCNKVELLRDIDYGIRTQKRENTKTMFESREEYEATKKETIKYLKENEQTEREIESNLYNALHPRLEAIRRFKKSHFWMKTGTIKLSTIHSFKGWEIPTLFLLIDSKDKHTLGDTELVYTGLTRARNNLFVFNLNNLYYHNFFENENNIKQPQNASPTVEDISKFFSEDEDDDYI